MNAQAYVEMARVQDAHWWYAARRHILRDQLGALQLPRDARILEVGCGTGANLGMLRQFGQVSGLEMAEDAISMARQARTAADGVDLVLGRCPQELDRVRGQFDLICLLDVLEHLDDDTHALQQLAKRLKPGGRLLLTVPAYTWLWGPHDEHHHHRRRYDRASLEAAACRAGLIAERITYFNTLLFPLALANRCVERTSGQRSRALEVPARPANALLQSVFAFERHLLRHLRLPWGLSLLLVTAPHQA